MWRIEKCIQVFQKTAAQFFITSNQPVYPPRTQTTISLLSTFSTRIHFHDFGSYTPNEEAYV